MCNILAPAWVIDYFIAFDVPIYNTIDKGIIAYVNKNHGSQ